MDLATDIILCSFISILLHLKLREFLILLFIQIVISSNNYETVKKKLIITIVLSIWLFILLMLIYYLCKIYDIITNKN
jgi:hypothetical protein